MTKDEQDRPSLQKCKDEVAQRKGAKDWSAVESGGYAYSFGEVIDLLDRAAEIYAHSLLAWHDRNRTEELFEFLDYMDQFIERGDGSFMLPIPELDERRFYTRKEVLQMFHDRTSKQ